MAALRFQALAEARQVSWTFVQPWPGPEQGEVAIQPWDSERFDFHARVCEHRCMSVCLCVYFSALECRVDVCVLPSRRVCVCVS